MDVPPTVPLHEAEVLERRQDKEKRRFQLVPFNDFTLDNRAPYLVEGILPREGLCVIYGPPKCGKSFWAFDLVMHVALGRRYRGRRVHQGRVLYIALEGERGIGARVAAFRQLRLAEPEEPVACDILVTRLDLANDHKALVDSIRDQMMEPPVVIVIDTLNRSMVGSESRDEDMAAYIHGVDALRETFGCLVVIIHHCGHDASRPRGHTSLTGAADAQIAVKRRSDLICTDVEWLKDGAEGDQTVSGLRVVEVGSDDEGEPITSCVIEPADDEAQAGRRERVTGQAGIALQLLRNAIIDEGEIPPACNHIPAKTKCVPLRLWRTYCYAGLLTNRDKERDKKDAQRKAFNRASQKLQTLGVIGVWTDWVWLVDNNGTSRTSRDNHGAVPDI